jgi:nitroreductase
MELFETIEVRHSVRAYKSDMVEKEKLDRIIHAAVIAPTAANFQPFKLFIIETKAHMDQLKALYAREWFSQAPIVLCVCTIPQKGWVRRDGRAYVDIDAAIVMDHITLTATALNLGTCWVGNFDATVARKMLRLDETIEPLLFTPLGYAKEHTYQKIRKPVEELVEYI